MLFLSDCLRLVKMSTWHIYRVDWMLDYQGMVCLACNQVWWTWEVEDVFRKVKAGFKVGMKEYAKKLHGQIDELVTRVRLCDFV